LKLKEALNTGYRITHPIWIQRPHWWYKKINEQEFIDGRGSKKLINKHIMTGIINWTIHPEDQKIVDFNNSLNQILEE